MHCTSYNLEEKNGTNWNPKNNMPCFVTKHDSMSTKTILCDDLSTNSGKHFNLKIIRHDKEEKPEAATKLCVPHHFG